MNFLAPSVRRLATYYELEESDLVYEQSQLNWKTYSIITASNNYSTFLCADLSEISLKQSSTGKTHYAPLIYCIDFHINVTV